MFNTSRYSQILEAVGMPQEHAEAHVTIIAEIIEGELATKQDMKEIKDEMQKLEYQLVIKLGALVTVAIAVAVTVLKII